MLKNSTGHFMSSRNRRFFIVAACMLILLTFFTACGTQEVNEGEKDRKEAYYIFTDDMGNEITLQEKPKQVAVLFSSYADVWVSAGGTVDITVGESIERGFAAKTATLVDDGAGKTINTEVLVASEPDLVICSADIEAQVEAAELLNSNGIPTACFQVDSFRDYLDMLKICTDITGDKEAYTRNGTEVEKRIEEVLQEAKTKDGEQKILFVRAGSSSSATKAKTADQHFACKMLQELGTYNIAENAAVLLDGLSIEEILREDPDYIFISTMGKEQEAIEYMDTVLQQPEWQSLTAIKTGRYTYLPKELFQFKPNARWDEAYTYLMDLLYGEKN